MHQEIISLFDESLGKELVPKDLIDDLLVISNDQDVDTLLILQTRWDIVRNPRNYFILNFTSAVADP